MDFSKWMPELINHVYWDEKEQFQLDHDTYVTWILFAVEEGQFEYRIGENSGQAGPRDIVIAPPYVTFYRKIISPLSFHAIAFDFPGGGDLSLQSMLLQRIIAMPRTARLFENYHHLRNEHQPFAIQRDNHRWKQHYFLDLWLMIMNQNEQQLGIAHSENEDTLINKVAQYFDNHAHHSIEIKQVANDFNLTAVQLIRRFKAVYHMNPLQYLTSIRIKKACSMLLETDWTLDVIARHCGYENGYYLSRVFSKYMGDSPSAFRRRNQF